MSSQDSAHLEKVQRRAARLIANVPYSAAMPHDLLLARPGLPTLESRRFVEQAVFTFRLANGGESLPRHLRVGLAHWFAAKPAATSCLRNADHFHLPRSRKNILKSSLYLSLSLWNKLSPDVKSCKYPHGLRFFLSHAQLFFFPFAACAFLPFPRCSPPPLTRHV